MKIQYASDLHLELSDNSRLFSHGIPLQAVGDVLILAGDCMYVILSRLKSGSIRDTTELFLLRPVTAS